MTALISLGLSIWLLSFVWKKEAKGMYMVTPLLLLFLYMLLRVFPGFAFSYFTGIFENQIIFLVFIVALIGLFFGFLGGSTILTGKTTFYSKFHDLDMEVTWRNPRRFVFALNFFSLILILTGLYLYNGLPYYLSNIEQMISGSIQEFGADFTEYRKEVTKGHYFGGDYKGQGALRTLQGIGWSIVICGYYSLFKFVSKKYRKYFYLSVLLAFFFVTGDGTRGPFLLTILSLVVLVSLSQRVSRTTIIRIGGVLFIILFAISLFNNKIREGQYQGSLILGGASNLIERVAVGNSVNDVYTIKLVDEGKLDLKYGRNILSELTNAIPGFSGSKPFANELYVLMTGNAGGTTYMTGTNIMRSYIDFGIVGVFVSFTLCGLIVFLFTRIYASRNKNLVYFSFYSVFIINVAQVYSVGFVGVMVNIFVLLIILNFILFMVKIHAHLSNSYRHA